jgi:jasmonate O-methyltransferase
VFSSSLHFLSKAPDGVSNSKRGRVYISSSSSASESQVLDAYAVQFCSDFSAFLRCRSPEMRPGGLVLATLVARRAPCPTAHDCYLWDLIADALMDMAATGIIDEEKVRAFNAPYYSPTPDDLLQTINSEGSFAVRTMQLFDITRRHHVVEEEKNEELISRRLAVETASTIRAVVEPMMRAHFFAMEMDTLFSRYRLLLEAYYHAEATHNKDDLTNVFLVLEKKQSPKCRC